MFMRYVNRTTERIAPVGAPGAVVLVRAAIAFVFVTTGAQKFLFPETLDVGRFTALGLPSAEIVASVVAAIEIACGALILLGLLTRVAALVLVVDTILVIAATKVPILLGHGYWGFADPAGPSGFWSMAQHARIDIVMLLGCAFLVSVGPGTISIDQRYLRRGGL
jgi:putative oxidoreductase